MKKAIALFLCLLMVTSLVACGNNNTATDDSQTSQVETENNETSTPEESETPTETETPVESEEPIEESAPAFDTSWASNEFEQQIAEPAFESWEKGDYTEDASWAINISDIHYDEIKEYAEALRSYGFSINEEEGDNYKGYGYTFEADNANGYHVDLAFEANDPDTLNGHASLEISK